VDRLRRLEEHLVAGDHLPLGDESEVVQERHRRAKELGDAAPVRRRVQVEDSKRAQLLRNRKEVVEHPGANLRTVCGDPELVDVDGLEHRASCRSSDEGAAVDSVLASGHAGGEQAHAHAVGLGDGRHLPVDAREIHDRLHPGSPAAMVPVPPMILDRDNAHGERTEAAGLTTAGAPTPPASDVLGL
jgi:hypothetical protein